MKLEICANSFQSALYAQEGGADRIELCSEFSVGGVTPSLGLLKEVKAHITIPVHVLIRPRSGNFVYSDAEFKQMKTDIEDCKKLGFDGIVSGVLQEDDQIDQEKTKELIDLARPLTFTFHRAFDCIPDPKEGLTTLKALGVDRILTSGQKTRAIEGIDLLDQLNKQAGKDIIILAGAGINSENIAAFKAAGIQEVHASCSIEIKEKKPFFDKSPQTVSDLQTIKELVQKINDE
ncbi:MAG: copper homeostasis protein CutC [Flavobacteriaceae bacterium]|nr:copper homeostasis protein CutC [Flavobacteriaceae bacterium]